MITKKIKAKQNGQALLFVVVAVTIAMAVGVSVSTRTLDLVRRITRTDTSARVIAASEAGIERLLNQTEVFLDSLEADTPDCSQIDGSSYAGGKCVVTFPPTSAAGDNITATAIVDAEKFKLNAPDHYWFNLDPGYVKEVNLNGYTENSIEVCWDNADTAVYFFSYSKPNGSSTLEMKKGGFYASNFPEDNKGAVSGFSQESQTRSEYVACGNVSLVGSPYGLRIKTYYSSTKIYVYPTGGATGSFPYQGYKLISKGELAVGNDVTDSKTINVYRSYSYSPSMFDYAIYTEGPLN